MVFRSVFESVNRFLDGLVLHTGLGSGALLKIGVGAGAAATKPAMTSMAMKVMLCRMILFAVGECEEIVHELEVNATEQC